MSATRVLLATGSATTGLALALACGHQIAPHVPSLFTFNVQDKRLNGLAGLAFSHVALTLTCDGGKKWQRSGPLLITHWGLSGPAVLKLSAFAALQLHASLYQAELLIDFLPTLAPAQVLTQLRAFKDANPRRTVSKHGPFPQLPRRFWEAIAAHCGIVPELTYAALSREHMESLVTEFTCGRYRISGKGAFKEEFVSAGGVKLREVDFRTMASRLCRGLYFAGEVLALDGITGGFNFQAAWTTAWIAAEAMATLT